MDTILFLLARNMHAVEPRLSYYHDAVFFHGFINLKVPRAVTKCSVATWWLCFFSLTRIDLSSSISSSADLTTPMPQDQLDEGGEHV